MPLMNRGFIQCVAARSLYGYKNDILKGGGREKFVFDFIAPRCCYSGVEQKLFRQLASKQRLEVCLN